MIDKKTKEPYINVWFGNFYRPAYDDKIFVKESIKLLKQCGFNSIMMDSKAWEDFRERFDGKWYRYWSDQVKETMKEHVRGLFDLYEENHTRIMIEDEERGISYILPGYAETPKRGQKKFLSVSRLNPVELLLKY